MGLANEVTLKEAIENMLHAYKLKGKIYEAQLVDSWGTIMGGMIEKHTRNVYLKHKKLYIKLDSSALRQELSYNRSKIIEKVNDALGAAVVDDIIFL
jgi:predicted nucleic acid-binding Zn ribbon protein